MHDSDQLKSIFATILSIPIGEVTDALSPETCAKWDSLHHIHLVNAIEEEFAVVLEFEDQMRMLSFALARDVVRSALDTRAPDDSRASL